MKKYILKAAGTSALLAALATGAFAQEDANNTKTTRRSDDVIIIKPKTKTDTKLTIEIKGDDVMVNGKPLAEFKGDDVNITRRKYLTITDQRTMRDDMDDENDDMLAPKRREEKEYRMRSDNKDLAELDDMRAEEHMLESKRRAELDALRAPGSRFRNSGSYSYSGPGNRVMVRSFNSNNAFLGVGTEKNEEGARITSVSDESAAQKAGLKAGDIITKINDTKISSPEELTKSIGKFKPADKITVTYKRDKKEQKATATLTKRKDMEAITLTGPNGDMNFKNFNFDFAPAESFGGQNGFVFGFKPRLGLKAQETEEGKGLKVLSVDDESAAEKAGIKEGDIITSFDGTPVNDIDKLRELSKPAIEKGNFKVQLTRDGKQQEIEVKIPKNLKTTNL